MGSRTFQELIVNLPIFSPPWMFLQRKFTSLHEIIIISFTISNILKFHENTEKKYFVIEPLFEKTS